ncbi:MAG: hypothetical protein QNJ16_21435 [Rhodobacter sp.]|nr:hypothetical protein [Rhodobacter sp.]
MGLHAVLLLVVHVAEIVVWVWMDDGLKIELCGPLRLVAPDGTDCAPRSSKAQGAVALLATGQNLSRSRAWLQAKLWSDRGRQQAAASLRQVLTELRKSLGDRADCLLADRKNVGFDPARVTVDTDGGGEFLEGIDVQDPNFQDWLRVERSRHSGTPIPDHGDRHGLPKSLQQRRLLVINNAAQTRGMESFFAEQFSDSVALTLSEQISVQIIKDESSKPSELDFVLRTSASMSKGHAGLSVSMQQGAQGHNLWSGSELVMINGAQPLYHDDVLRLVNEASENVSEALYSAARLGTGSLDAAVLTRIAVRKLFSMEKSEQVDADAMLATAFDLHPRAVYLAWRVLLRIVMLIERHSGLPDDYVEEANEMSQQALELEPMNSMVLAAAANAALVLRSDNTAGLEYAERSLKANPANPFAWDCMSMAGLYHGHAELANRAQIKARHIAGNTPFGHWFDMGCAVTATTIGQIREAIIWARKSAAMSPSFHPPLRYLIALYAHSGQMAQALDIVRRLQKLEPDFSVDQLVADEDYPVNDLRRSKLLSPSLVSALT